MNKFILCASLLLLLFGFVSSSSSPLSIVSKRKGYKLSTDLHATYAQQSTPGKGYHEASVYFNTTVPSINPDEAGVTNIECSGNSITLSLNDDSAIQQISSWPDKVMLLVSHKWNCFGKASTQFFMAESKTIDPLGKKVSFTVNGCNITEWANNFRFDVSWVKGNENARRRRRGIFGDNFRFDESNKLNLNVFFDEATGKSSSPNLSLVKDQLFCANCFMQGEATIKMVLDGSILPTFSLNEASVSVDGNIKLNLDFLVNLTSSEGIGFSQPGFELINIPITPGFSLPGAFNVGPSIKLIGSGDLFANITGSATFGGEVGIPNFNVASTFVGDPVPSQSGFKPEFKSHGLDVNFDVSEFSIDVNGSLKPQLAFEIKALDIFSQAVGFELATTLGNNILVSKKNKCEKFRPRLTTVLNNTLAFFVNENEFPIVEFKPIPLLDRCFN